MRLKFIFLILLGVGLFTLSQAAVDYATITVTVIDSALPGEFNTENYALDTLKEGKTVYIDRDVTFSKIPSALKNKNVILVKLAGDERNNSNYNLSFNIYKPANLYVGHDARLANNPPEWLKTKFALTKDEVKMNNNRGTFSLWKTKVETGEIKLGSNNSKSIDCAMYVLFLEL